MGSSGLQFLWILLLILVNAFFVAAEFALVSLRRSRVEQMVEEGIWPGVLLKQALEHLDTYIATTQLGVTMAGLALGASAEPYLARLLAPSFITLLGALLGPPIARSLAFILAFGVITFLTLVLGELAPKGLALQQSEQVARRIILPLNLFLRVFWPFVRLINRAGNLVLKALHLPESSTPSLVGSPEELRLILEDSSQRGMIDQAEGEVIRQVLDLEETQVKEIMVPRVEIVGIEAQASLRELLELTNETRYSRIPIYQDGIDQIIGIAYAKDLLSFSPEVLDSTPVSVLARKPYFVPEFMPAWELLRELRRRKTHMAIVVDEFGGTAGLVTLEDVVEEIVGEIYDESDEEEPAPVKKLAEGLFLIDALAPLEEVSEALGIELPKGEYETLSGLLMERLGHIPQVGEELNLETITFTVEAADPRRVERVRAQVHPAQDLSPEAR
jgi:putative hemolysin